jgi:hypothetical protein
MLLLSWTNLLNIMLLWTREWFMKSNTFFIWCVHKVSPIAYANAPFADQHFPAAKRIYRDISTHQALFDGVERS